MRHARRVWRDPRISALLVLAFGMLLLPDPRPALAQSADEAWAPVTIVYTSDIKGHIEPCG